jgi:hypothetical protein
VVVLLKTTADDRYGVAKAVGTSPRFLPGCPFLKNIDLIRFWQDVIDAFVTDRSNRDRPPSPESVPMARRTNFLRDLSLPECNSFAFTFSNVRTDYPFEQIFHLTANP